MSDDLISPGSTGDGRVAALASLLGNLIEVGGCLGVIVTRDCQTHTR